MAEPLTEPRFTIRPATVHDTAEILELVNALATDQLMLPRSPASVIENVRDFVVAEVDGGGPCTEADLRQWARARVEGRHLLPKQLQAEVDE